MPAGSSPGSTRTLCMHPGELNLTILSRGWVGWEIEIEVEVGVEVGCGSTYVSGRSPVS